MTPPHPNDQPLPAVTGVAGTASYPAPSTDLASYAERLTVTWWLWPASLAVVGFIVTEATLGAAVRYPYAYLGSGLLTAAALLWLGRLPIRVQGGVLHVDDARLPLAVIGEVHVLDAAARRDLLGMDAEPFAFVIARPWVSGGVRIDLADPADPTPYWYVSTRHPHRLAAVLRGETVAPSPS